MTARLTSCLTIEDDYSESGFTTDSVYPRRSVAFVSMRSEYRQA
jgi:hypothetical protein